MLRFTSLFEDLLSLEKARKKVDLHKLASDMDSSLGPWPKEMGARAEAVEHVLKFGRSQSLQLKDAAPGTPEHKAYTFVRDARAHAAKKSPAVVSSRKASFGTDSLEGPIDKEHIDHYANVWSDHHFNLENKTSAKSTDAETGRLVTRSGRKIQARSLVVTRRMNHMSGAGAKDLIASSDDLDTIHSGVDRAIQAGKVPVADANRYHVMRATLKRAESRHKESYPGVPFKPSYASMDTAALRTMRTGLDHLHETGFAGARERLTPSVSAALASHDAHPFVDPSRKSAAVTGFAYPALHKIGSTQHSGQQDAISRQRKRLDTARGFTSEPGPKSAPAKAAPAAAAPKELELPGSYDEYRSRVDRGEKFEPAVHTRMEKLRIEQRRASLNKSLASNALVKSLRTRRRKAS